MSSCRSPCCDGSTACWPRPSETCWRSRPSTRAKIDNLDPQLRRASGFAFYNTSRYDFEKLLADAPHIAQNLRNYIAAFSPNMREVLEKFDFDNTISKLDESGILFQVVQRFGDPQVNLHPDAVDNAAMGTICYIRSTKTGEEGRSDEIENRALSEDELERRQRVDSFIATASEDRFTEKVILPLLQTLRFQRFSVAGHKDKALEFGKDMWMKYRLPTGHWLYFGLQIKRGRIDSSARTSNENIAEVHHQVTMMLGHPVFDPDINKKRLVDHAIIVAGGEITKQAKHWLGERLDASQRSQILFMDRNDILHLFVVHKVPMPDEDDDSPGDDIPF